MIKQWLQQYCQCCNSLRKAKESLLESSIYHTVILMTLSLLIIKDLKSSFLTFTPKNSQFLKHSIRPAYGVYASQLIRYARCCSNYSDFLLRHRALVTRLLSQGYKVDCLSNTFKKFYGRHTDLVGQYKKNVCQMFADSIS